MGVTVRLLVSVQLRYVSPVVSLAVGQALECERVACCDTSAYRVRRSHTRGIR